MLYRIRVDLSFATEDPPDDILDKALDHLGESQTINPHKDYEERGYIQVEKCYHDEDPLKPCEIIARHETS